jgi:hypothetical protein
MTKPAQEDPIPRCIAAWLHRAPEHPPCRAWCEITGGRNGIIIGGRRVFLRDDSLGLLGVYLVNPHGGVRSLEDETELAQLMEWLSLCPAAERVDGEC